MAKQYQANQFLQGAESSLDTDYTSDLLRGSTVKRPKQTSRYNQSPIELVHLARIVPQQTEEVRKHYLCIVMLNQSEKASFHIVHCSSSGGTDLREVNYVFISNIGQLKLVTQAKALELIDLQGAMHREARFTF